MKITTANIIIINISLDAPIPISKFLDTTEINSKKG